MGSHSTSSNSTGLDAFTSNGSSSKGHSSANQNSSGELLILIVDCNPLWWMSLRKSTGSHVRVGPGSLETRTSSHPLMEEDGAFLHVWQSLLALGNAHLMLEPENELAILGVAPGSRCGARFLYTSADAGKFALGIPGSSVCDGKIESLALMNRAVHHQLMQLLLEYQEELMEYSNGNHETSAVPSMPKSSSTGHTVHTRDFIVSSALTKALCYYGRRLRETKSVKVDSDHTILPGQAGSSLSADYSGLQGRVLVVRGSVDCASQYMHMMNAVFSAQKLRVPVDVCHLIAPTALDAPNNQMGGASSSGDNTSRSGTSTESGGVSSSGNLLQQAVKLTGGLYVPVMHWEGLLQYLLSLFLPRVSLRSSLVLACGSGPAAAVRAGLLHSQVDFRAACFCHRRLVDVAFVCSVCLSIFCAFRPFCTTCFAKFKLLPGTTGGVTASSALPAATAAHSHSSSAATVSSSASTGRDSRRHKHAAHL